MLALWVLIKQKIALIVHTACSLVLRITMIVFMYKYAGE